MIDEQYIRDRISVLRTNKGISEYKMSLDLGHSKSYMQSISSGRAMPSWTEFLYICEYLGTTPKEFFDEDLSEPSFSHNKKPQTSRLRFFVMDIRLVAFFSETKYQTN